MGGIDWSKIKTIEDIYENYPQEVLYDTSNDIASSYELMPGLTDEEVEDAMFWKSLYIEIRKLDWKRAII